MKVNIVSIILVLTSWTAFAQNAQETAFNNGKALFNTGKYELAMQALKPAMEASTTNAYESYASFYYALSAYRSNFKPLARDMFLQVVEKFPSWEYVNECRYWVSLIHFETNSLHLALTAGEEINDSSIQSQFEDLEYKYLSALDSMDLLRKLYEQHPKNQVLAEIIINKMESLSYQNVDIDFLNQIASDHQISISSHSVPDQEVKKDVYKVAVLFPFIWRNMETSGIYLRKSLVVDLYEGIRLGVEKLRQQGINIQLISYDTGGDSLQTAELLNKPELLGVDLIIGPLVPGASALVRAFAYHNKINMVNPISNNSSAVSGNPYAFLMNPDEITLGKKAGEYVVNELTNKNTLVYFGDRKTDLNMANAFQEVVEADSFQIVGMDMVRRDSTEWIFDYLTAKQDVLDSLGEVVYYKDDEEDEEEEEKILEEYVILPDSIGSIFVSTFDYKIASEVFSSVANRGDSIQIVGHGGWLLDKTANYQYMQDLGIVMMAPEYIDFNSEPYLELERIYIQSQRVLPSRFVIAGYDCMVFMGTCLSRFGVYFQNGLQAEVMKDAGLRHGYDYRTSNDNRYIPLVHFENLTIRVQEPEN